MSIATELAMRTPRDDLPSPRPRPRLGRLLQAAATRTRNSLTFTLSTLAGLMALANGHIGAGLAVMGAGAAAFGLLVLRDMFDPALIRQVHQLAHRPLALERLGWSPAPHPDLPLLEPAAEHRELCASIAGAHAAIRARLEAASPFVRISMRDAYRRCTEMAQLVAPLAARGRELGEYLGREPIETVEEEACALEVLAGQSDDPGAVRDYAAAARTQRAHLEACRQIEGLRDQVTAQLAVIRATLQLVEARLVKLTASDADIDRDLFRAVEELSNLLSLELGSVEAAVREVAP